MSDNPVSNDTIALTVPDVEVQDTDDYSGVDPEDVTIVETHEQRVQRVYEMTKMTEDTRIPWLHNVPDGYEADFLDRASAANTLPTDEQLNSTQWWRIGSNETGRFDHFAIQDRMEQTYRKWSLPENFQHLKSCPNCFQSKIILPDDVLATENETCNYHDPEFVVEDREYDRTVCMKCDPEYFSPEEGAGGQRRRPLSGNTCLNAPNHNWISVQAEFWREAFTVPPKDDKNPKAKILAFDCEMVGVTRILAGQKIETNEIISLSAVDATTNEILINCILIPDEGTGIVEIDYRHGHTGASPELLEIAKAQGKAVYSLKALQDLICSVADQETIIVGWAVHNDLRCLKLAHNRIIDVQVLERVNSMSWKVRGLKDVARGRGIKIQNGTHGSLEDAYATAEILRIYMGLYRWLGEISTLDRRRRQAVTDRIEEIRADIRRKAVLRLPPASVTSGIELKAWQGNTWSKLRRGQQLVAGQDFQPMSMEDHPVREVKR